MLHLQPHSIAQLTGREAEVLQLVAKGLSAKEVALELHIAPCTVERHIENVRLKTRTRNRAHMVAFVIQEGWLTLQGATAKSQDAMAIAGH
jgi:LuxR family transcriptional regulator of spore coat protein